MLNQYRSCWLSLEPTTSTAVHELQIPAPDSLLTSAKSLVLPNRSRHEKFNPEENFAFTSLATHGAFFFRKAVSPLRSFFWRVLEAGRVLEIRSTDLTRSQADEQEATTVLKFTFPSQIIPNLVAFVDHPNDSESGDVYAFLITESKHFYTLKIDPGHFRDVSMRESEASRWCYYDVPTTLTVNEPYKISAPSPFEVFIAYRNGVLARLRRSKDWSRKSSRGVKFPTIAPNTIEPSSDQQFVFTICLDNTLKIWNQATGKMISETNLLNGNRSHANPTTPPMNPASASFIRSFYLGSGQHSLVTFAPNADNQVKFWDVNGGLTTPISVKDRFPQIELRLPDPDPSGNSVWSLTGLETKSDENQRPQEMWALWRSNNLHRLFSVQFDFSDPEPEWEQSWVETSFTALSDDAPPDPSSSSLVDTTERWCTFLLRPGRFDLSVLQTSLSMYQEALNLKRVKMRKGASLEEQLCSSVASSVSLRRYEEREIDYDRFFADSDAQWRQIWRIARNLQARLRAPLSLSFDKFSGTPWVAMTGCGCLIRRCSKIEMACLKDRALSRSPLAKSRGRGRRADTGYDDIEDVVSRLVLAASVLRHNSSPELFNSIETALLAEVYQEEEKSPSARLTDFYESSNMANELTDEAYEATMETLEKLGGPPSIDNDLFNAALNLLPENIKRHGSALRYNDLGLRLVTAGASDIIFLCRQVLIDLFSLVLFLEFEMDQEEMRSIGLEAAELFPQFMTLFKDYEERVWLVTSKREKNVNALPAFVNSDSTILQDLFAPKLTPQPAVNISQGVVITESIERLVTLPGGDADTDPDDISVYILCNLINNNDLELAGDFLRFQSNSPWAAYGRGRVCLARRDFDASAFYFRKSAYYLAHGKAKLNVHIASAGLISALESDSFFHGLPRFYHHILALFEKAKAYSYVADFAHLGLQSLSRSQSASDALQLELLTRLVTAELQCCNYIAAYTAISRLPKKALQKSSLRKLIESIVSTTGVAPNENQALSLLKALPIGLDSNLNIILDDTLSSFARKQSTVSISSEGRRPQTNTTDFIGLLCAHRVGRNDFRGSVSVLLDRLNRIKGIGRARNDPQAVELRRAYLYLINTLASVAPEDAYIMSEISVSEQDGRDKKRRRIIVTLEDVRREYQALLDRCSRIERGDYEFYVDGEGAEDSEGDDEMEVDSTTKGAGSALMSGAMDVS
ncbi:MAG: hypothetical protein Q9160_007252 [Pyrenula sp. 1 TL-2023]